MEFDSKDELVLRNLVVAWRFKANRAREDMNDPKVGYSDNQNAYMNCWNDCADELEATLKDLLPNE